MKKSTLLISTGVATGAFLIGLTLSNPFVSAYQNGAWQREQGFSPETKAQIEQSIENGDYNTWKSLTDGKGRMGETITEENFPLLKELHTAQQNGDTTKAQELRQKLGLPEPRTSDGKCGKMGKHGAGREMINPETKAQIEQSIENGDYNTWKSLTDGKGRMGETITEENFPLLKELHTAQQNGDTTKAQELRQKLGLPEHGKGRGIHNQKEEKASVQQ